MKTPVSVVVRHAPSGLTWPDAGDHVELWDNLLLLGLGLVLGFAALAFGTTEPWSEFILECGAAALFLLWAVRQVVGGELELRPSPLYFPTLAFALLVAAQLGFGISVYRYATVQECFRYLAYGMLRFVAIQCFHSRQQIQRFLLGMSVFGTLLAVFAILQDLTSNGKLYWVRPPMVKAWAIFQYVINPS